MNERSGMSDLVDLHVHSSYSCDADYPPAEIVRMAAGHGYRAVSIADHDTVAAYPEALEAGRLDGVEIIPGIELTTVYDGREFHLLLPFVDWTGRAIGRIIEEQTERRRQEAKARVAKMQELGFSIDWDEVEEKSRGVPPLGIKIAEILLGNRKNRKNPVLEPYYAKKNGPRAPYLLYRDFFGQGKPAWVAKNFIRLEQALQAAPETGGVPVLAHPGASFQMTTAADLEILKPLGLAGLEVFTSYHTPEQILFYGQLAGKMGLIPTAGSDFHGRIKPHVIFGAMRDGKYWMVEKLRGSIERKREGR